MALRVGIPRGLLYYYYGDIWQNFFRRLGAEVVVSGETSQAMLDQGGLIDEVCMPVKIAAAHAAQLVGQADYLFLPRVVSVAAGQYTCPEIIGLPDMVRSNFPNLPPLIDVTVNLRQGRRGLFKAVTTVGELLGKSPLVSLCAWLKAVQCMEQVAAKRELVPSRLYVALIGHPYMLYDRQVSLDILRKLRNLGICVVTADEVEAMTMETVTRRLPKKIFWHYCDRLAGAAMALMYSLQPPDGMIFLSSFACGPDSLVGEILKQHARQLDLPFLAITVDEHTAEAGFNTRLEAFSDMLTRRKSG